MVDLTEEETQALPAVMRALAPDDGARSAGTGRSRELTRERGAPADRGRRRGLSQEHGRDRRADDGDPVLMLDFNHRPSHRRARQRARRCRARGRTRRHAAARLSRRLPPRPCLRAGAAVRVHRDAEGRRRRLRRPDACASSRSATRWRISRSAGCAPPGSISTPARATDPTASSSASRSPAAASAAMSTASSPPAPAALGLRVPALWECKTMNAKNWRETASRTGVAIVEAGLRRADRALPGLHGSDGPRHRRHARRCSPRSTRTPPSSTTSWCRSTRVSRSACPTARVRILRATDAGELLPRIATTPRFPRMPLLRLGGALLEPAGMSDDTIIHFNPWRDFNDAPPPGRRRSASSPTPSRSPPSSTWSSATATG